MRKKEIGVLGGYARFIVHIVGTRRVPTLSSSRSLGLYIGSGVGA